MAPLPKRRHSSHRTGKRRSQIKLTLPQLIPCSHCQQPTLPHQTCPHCHHYAGRHVYSAKPAKSAETK